MCSVHLSFTDWQMFCVAFELGVDLNLFPLEQRVFILHTLTYKYVYSEADLRKLIG